jgi:hypothetical protein
VLIRIDFCDYEVAEDLSAEDLRLRISSAEDL